MWLFPLSLASRFAPESKLETWHIYSGAKPCIWNIQPTSFLTR